MPTSGGCPDVGIIYRHAVPRAVRYVPGERFAVRTRASCAPSARSRRPSSRPRARQPARSRRRSRRWTGSCPCRRSCRHPCRCSASGRRPESSYPARRPDPDSGWDPVRIRLRRRVRIGFRIRLRIRVGIGFLRHRDRHRGRHRRHRDGCDGDCGRTGLQRLHRAVLADADRVTCDRPRDRLVDGILGVTVTPRPTLWPTVMSSLPSLTPSPVTARPVT